MFLGNFIESTSPGEVYRQGDQEDKDGSETWLDVDGVEEEAGERLVNDVEGGEDEQTGLKESREVFEFAVTVGMTFVGRPVGDTDRKKSDHGGDQVEAGMQGFGEDAKAAGAPDEKGLQAKEKSGGANAEKSGLLLFLDDRMKAP